MEREEIEEIRKRCEAATPGPWKKWHCRDSHNEQHGSSCRGVLIRGNHTMPTEADDDFVAHAREDIPALLSALDEKDREIERLREALNIAAKDMCRGRGTFDESEYKSFATRWLMLANNALSQGAGEEGPCLHCSKAATTKDSYGSWNHNSYGKCATVEGKK